MSIDDSDEWVREEIPTLPAAAMAIGQLCQEWSELEHCVLLLLGIVSAMPRSEHTLTILRCFDFRDQVAAIKVAAALRIKDAELQTAIIGTMDHIDNALRPRRNRIVHDRWNEAEPVKTGVVVRVNGAPKLKREKAFGPIIVKANDETTETLTDLYSTVDEIKAYANYLCLIVTEAASPSSKATLERREARPQQPYPPRQW